MSRWTARILTALVALPAATLVSAQPNDRDQIEYRVAHVSASAGGVYLHSADQWSRLTLRLVNRQEHPVELLCTSYFDTDPTLQYGRRVWLPPRSRLETWYPIRIPPLEHPDQKQVSIHTMVSNTGDSQEAIVRSQGGQLQIHDVLRVAKQPLVAGIVGPQGDDLDADQPSVSVGDLVATAQLDQKLPRSVTTLGDRLLPATEEGLQAFDVLVIADDRILGDAAGLTALQQWLFNGGRLWVMLDRVDPTLLDVLLQNASGCSAVDDITLTDVTVTAGPDHNGSATSTAQFERPVKLVRSILDGEEQVPFVVDGWPAAFTRICGAGQLLVTTLESTAWVTRADERDIAYQGLDATGFVSTPPFRKLMEETFTPVSKPPDVAALLEPHVGEYVGYSIPSRGLVLGLLGGFVLLLMVIGVVLRRAGRLEQLAIAGPVLALLVAGLLMGVGAYQQQQVPPMRALLQLVQPLSGTDQVQIQGAAALYARRSGTLELYGREGGRMIPDLSGTSGTTRRLIRTDLDEWIWANVPRSPGLRTARQHVPLQRPPGLLARAQFGPDGLTGSLQLPDDLQAEDAVVVTRNGRLGVQMQADGQFEVNTQRVLSGDEYLQADLLSDEQARRSRITARLLSEGQLAANGAPVLCCWTDPWPAGVGIDEGQKLVGAALVAIPLQLLRPVDGTVVHLPAPLLTYRAVIGPDGLYPSGLYDYRKNQWSEKLRPSSTWLRFQLPPALVPIDLTSARVTLRVRGPIGSLVISIDRDGRAVPVRTWDDPIGTLEFEFPESDLPHANGDGGVLLRIDAGDSARPTTTDFSPESERQTYWQIESLQLELDGVVAQATDLTVAQHSPSPEPRAHIPQQRDVRQ